MIQGPDRRQWLAGAAAATALPAVAQTGAAYGYAFGDVRPRPGETTQATLRRLAARRPLGPDGGRILGVFVPQLGWRSSQAAVLFEAGRMAPGPGRFQPELALSQDERLTATARPATGQAPRPGGIYVHRWFVVKTSDVPEVVELSVLGWRDFERRFETNIFGLFTAAQTPVDRRADQTRLLLLTRYRDHGVWEASRDPSTEAMAAFARRARLTRASWAASTLLLPAAET